ncbi:MAG: sialidase family protein [Paludibacteraceae bacterium]|nr:sialidase family protein [Paludibacteraceae bacterium]
MKTTKFLYTCCLLLALLFGGQTLQAQNTRMVQTSNEIVRINPQKANQIDYSTNGGRTWISRYTGTSCGDFIDMVIYNGELIAITSKGVYYSTSSGRTWINRYSGTSCGKFLSLMNNDKELLAQTDKGLYYSTNSGRTWMRR